MNNECPYNALKAAVQKIGGQSAMARLISTKLRPIRQGHIWMWLNRNKKLPPEFVLTVEAATGVSRYALRPDIFGYSPPSRSPSPLTKMWPDMHTYAAKEPTDFPPSSPSYSADAGVVV